MHSLNSQHRRIVLQGPGTPFEKLVQAVLIPLSLLYGLVVWLRNKGYDLRLLKTYRASVPVISVGNLTAGGTGKTPVVDLLLKEFTRLGYRPAIVSRGFGGSFAGDVGVVSDGQLRMSAAEAGDEPFLLARRNPTALVVVAKRRGKGIKHAMSSLGADLILLDDGFQHRAVERDADLVLLDGTQPLGNGLPLPAGLLREFPSSLERADLLLFTRTRGGEPFLCQGKPAWNSRHRLAEQVVSLAGERVELEKLAGKRTLAFAGIADPEPFFRALEMLGLQVEKTISFADHQSYDPKTLAELRAAAEGFDLLVTTEKDAVKLSPDEFSVPCYQVPLNIEINQKESFLAALQEKIRSRSCR
jgi:tetraacyldisaccharide 4'-kinase